MRKKVLLKITALLMLLVAIKGVVFVVTDNEFHYNGLPMWAVYMLLTAYCLGTGYVLYRAFIRNMRTPKVIETS